MLKIAQTTFDQNMQKNPLISSFFPSFLFRMRSSSDEFGCFIGYILKWIWMMIMKSNYGDDSLCVSVCFLNLYLTNEQC